MSAIQKAKYVCEKLGLCDLTTKQFNLLVWFVKNKERTTKEEVFDLLFS